MVVSGKGGTGKTLLVASLAVLAEHVLLVDADVEAPNLRIIVGAAPPREEHYYYGGEVARIDGDHCKGCGRCVDVCRFGAVSINGVAVVDGLQCEGCAACFHACPENAVVMERRCSGQWWVADCRYGVIVHGKLAVGEGTSGKLVSEMKGYARKLVGDFLMRLIDGPPGAGCPVIAALTGADLAVVVTEPTLSGLHDAKRVTDVAAHFGVKTAVCVNKADLNPQITATLKKWVQQNNFIWLGELPFDKAAYEAMSQGISVVEQGGHLAEAIKQLWKTLKSCLT